ncbi:nucleoside triphosphate pyrophosphohydrolase [Metabacillus idriensis]|uniref:nucleoside triphosphate pyrophosphohydrolase n=1 Tax=Metabacillus idriensis TaxID=324768 RepID=UPI0017483079|nr:nucleoside triphosphate pyrophosphohydrolase [Metabacillus idriensis]
MGKKITVVGLGGSDASQLPLGIYRKLTSAAHLFFRTKEHPVIEELKDELPDYHAFDYLYEENDQFGDVYSKIVESLYKEAEDKEIVYAVPGHPLVAEQTVQLLLQNGEQKGFRVHIAGGQSFLDATFTALQIDPIDGFQMVDGLTMQREQLNFKQHLIICQVYDQMVASEVKLTLMEELPDDYEVSIVTGAGSSGQTILKVPLFELDRVTTVNNLTSVYVPPVRDERILNHQFSALRSVIAELRGPNGCPWDLKQTHKSLKKYLIEECYELIEAIDEEDDDHVVEELGDVLLQVMLHSQIGSDEGIFSIDDVIRTLTDKMIRRHPHVFSNTVVTGSEEVLSNWEQIKRAEKESDEKESILKSVAGSLPALSKAYHIQKKAAKVGFDWDDVESAWDKVREEIQEFKDELTDSDSEQEKILAEFGDILFAFVNIGRFYGIEPEEALTSTNHKFKRRFEFIEKKANEQNSSLEEMALEEMDSFWNEAKRKGL